MFLVLKWRVRLASRHDKSSWFHNRQSVGWFIELERKVDAFLTVLIPKSVFFFSCWFLLCNKCCPLGADLKISSENFKTRRRFPQVCATSIGKRAQIIGQGSTLTLRCLFWVPAVCFSFQKLIGLPAYFYISVIFCFALAATISYFIWNIILLKKRPILSVYSVPSFSRVNILKHWLRVFCPVLLLAGMQSVLDWSQE